MKKTILLICSVVLITIAQAQIPTDSLLCHYPFNNDVMDNANANHGTNDGATFANDRFGNPNKALFIDSTDFVDFGDVDLTTPNFTLSFWLNHDSISSPQYIISKRTTCNASNFFNIHVNETNVGMELYSGTNNSGNAAAGGTININTWHHIVFIADTANQKTDKYVDGVMISTKSWATPMGSIDNASSLVLAKSVCNGVNGSINYTGYVDDIRIYKRTLDSNEVLALFNEENPVSPPPTPSNIKEKEIIDVSIYPNPSNGIINIDSSEKINTIHVFDITGKTVLTKTTNTIDLTNLENGFYFIEVNTPKGTSIKKIIKK